MSDVRAAAERLLTNFMDRYYIDVERGNFVADVATVCEAILAEHLADDDEPVNEAWLISIGFFCDQYGIVSASTDALCLTWFGKGDFGCDHVPFEAKTRGDVRRLCRALGVEVKE